MNRIPVSVFLMFYAFLFLISCTAAAYSSNIIEHRSPSITDPMPEYMHFTTDQGVECIAVKWGMGNKGAGVSCNWK